MNQYALLSLFFLLPLHLSAQQSADFGAPKFAPSDSLKLLIIGQDLAAVGGLPTYQHGYLNHLPGPPPAGVTTYTSLPKLNGLRHFDSWGAGHVLARLYAQDTTFANCVIVIGLYLVGELEAIAAGKHNQAIRSFAAWVKEQQRPIMIRIGYEFEGEWNSYEPEAYKAAWRQIVHTFDAEQVRNAAYVWQSAGMNVDNIADWYPGDEYVNWVAFSQFDGGNKMGQRMIRFAEAHDKPVMIAEATPKVDLTSGEGEAHWANWYQPLFDRLYANDRLKALAYINTDWDSQPMWKGQGWGDSRVQVNALVKERWIAEMAKSIWLKGEASLFSQLGYENK
ncbi:MAG: glycosyl hydrolase [Bacteroidota bacterium]